MAGQKLWRLLVCSQFLTCSAVVPAASAQAPPPAQSRASDLARAWTAIAKEDYRAAEQIALQLLKRSPGDHAAVLVNITALSSSHKPLPALDTYERWLQPAGTEDIFLLEPIAVATLVTLAMSDDPGIASESLTRLARYDADAARLVLEGRGAAGSFDGARVVLGDASATTRLTEALASPSPQVKLRAIRQLKGAKGLAPGPVAALLSDAAPPVRAAAAEVLAANEGTAAIPRLRPLLKDPDPFVRATTAVALGRLGDPEAGKMLDQMAQSPVGDTAAMAAVVLKEQGADVSAIAQRLLADQNPLTRLSAVALLKDTDGARADALLRQAAGDANPVIRSRAAELMAQSPIHDLALLRQLLRDDNSEVRGLAAGSLLRLSSGH